MFALGPNGLSGPLYNKDQIPEQFHESFIVKGYRSPKSSPFQCVLSLFDATNETLNFWTHFLPSWYFMWILKGLSETLDFRHDSYTWPLLGYMCMCCIYPLASATAHTFNTMSDNARHICFFLDYSAIAASALSVAIVYRAYSFPSELRFTIFGDIFIPIGGICAVIFLAVACDTRFMRPSTFRKVLRLGSLGLPCVYDTIPLMYRLICGTEQELNLSSHTHHVIGIVCMYIAAALYGLHFPERLFPGSFDIVGHSHQLFHMATITGTMEQMQALLNDMQERKAELQASWEFGDVGTSIGILGTVLIINTVVVAIFSVRLCWKIKVKSA